MAKFLNTSAINYYLEELIKKTRERLIIISPFLRFNDRIKELLADVDRLKIDVRLVYGKSELAPQEINWLRSLEFLRTSFCHNLHAKCYMNENAAIVSSMNLYDFSQVNNNEMGVFIDRSIDGELYVDVQNEAQRLIRISEQIRLSADPVNEAEAVEVGEKTEDGYEKLTTSKLAKAMGIPKNEMDRRLVDGGYLLIDGDKQKLSDLAKALGAEFRYNKQRIPYFLWPKDFKI